MVNMFLRCEIEEKELEELADWYNELDEYKSNPLNWANKRYEEINDCCFMTIFLEKVEKSSKNA